MFTAWKREVTLRDRRQPRLESSSFFFLGIEFWLHGVSTVASRIFITILLSLNTAVRNKKVDMATVAPCQLTFLAQSKLSLPKPEEMLALVAQSKLSLL